MKTPDFDLIFKFLPVELKNDPFFNQIEEIIKSSKDIKFLGQIKVPDSVYEQIEADDQVWFRKAESEYALLYFQMLIHEGMISFGLKREDDQLILMFCKTDIEKHQDIKITLTKHPNASKIITTKTETLDGKIIDYDYDIHIYNSLYETIPVDLEILKDIEFATVFGIPIEFASFFRTHFKKYVDYLNVSREKAEMDSLTKEVMRDGKYQFRPPFQVSEFLDFVNSEEDKEMRAIDPKYSEGASFKESKQSKYLIKLLTDLVGNDGQIVISESLYSIFVKYLYNFNTFLYTEGFILKKSRDGYILYYVDFTKDNTFCVPCLVDQEHLDMMYYKSKENENVEGLKEFFGIDPEETVKR